MAQNDPSKEELRAENARLRARCDELEQALHTALAQSDRMKDEFLAILSHELRTPLNAIVGFGSILEDEVEAPLAPSQRWAIEHIMAGADALVAIVSDMLDLSRIRQGRFTLSLGRVALAEVVTEVLAAQATKARAQNHTLVHAVPTDLPMVQADRHRVGQMIAHLVGNAIKYTPPGGRIVVRAEPQGAYVRCEIEDDGPGIPAEAHERIFDRFRQLDQSDTRRHGGLGLGLAFVKGLVEAHGGVLGVESAPGCGATFHLTLPRYEA